MATGIPVLWSDDINVEIVSPLAILRAQLDPLRTLTKGLLEGEIVSNPTEVENEVEHVLYLVAPTLSNYRFEILSLTHQDHLVYPVAVESVAIEENPRASFRHVETAETEDRFIQILGEVLRSDRVRSVIHALLARINEEKATNEDVLQND